MRELRANGAAARAGAPLGSRGRSFKTRPGSGCASPAPRPLGGSGRAGAAGPGDAREDVPHRRGLKAPARRRDAGEEPVQPGGRWLRLARPAAQRGGLPARHPLPGQGEPRPGPAPRLPWPGAAALHPGGGPDWAPCGAGAPSAGAATPKPARAPLRCPRERGGRPAAATAGLAVRPAGAAPERSQPAAARRA